MKLLRFGELGQEKPGMLDADGNLRSLANVIDDLSGATLTRAGLDQLKNIDPTTLPQVEGAPRIGACVGEVSKFMCIGLNYSDHAEESGMEVPAEPVLFMKATSAICGPFDDVLIPPGSEKTDWEVELGIVIGDRAKHVSEENALNHVAGYCVINDLSERAYQLERCGQWVKGKSCDTFAPFGPFLATPDEIDAPNNLGMWLKVNGETRQSSNSSNLHFKIPFLLSYVSQFMTLK